MIINSKRYEANMKKQTHQKVAVVGCGAWGKNLVRNFFELGALDVICEPDQFGREMAMSIAPGIPIIEDFNELMSSDIGAVVLATPAETHFSLAKHALELGKDVFVEKPLALTFDEGSRLVEIADINGNILMVGHVLEYHPGIVQLIRIVSEGELGKIQYIYSNRLSLGKVRREENILWSFAPHDIAIILRMMGKMPIQVSSFGGSYIQPDIADVTITGMLFDDGVRAHIHVSWLHPFKEQRLVVIGARKMVSFDDVDKSLVLHDKRVEIKNGKPIPIRGEGEVIHFEPDEPLRFEAQAFLDAVQSRKQPLTDGNSGLRVLKVLQAAQKSLSNNGIPIDLSFETSNLLSKNVLE